jgi:hypothetical protein
MQTQKCNKNFITQHAYINNNEIPININKYTKTEGDKITCKNGHELVLCQGTKVKKYFRHKNENDTGGDPMTEWHCRMQSYFPNTEFVLKKINQDQIKERRADAIIHEDNCIIEFEHSGKTQDEIICKARDCSLHGMDIIWFIDGNTTDVMLEELSTGNFLITFANDWKYKSFIKTYDFVLLDIDNKIFKIPVKNVCNKMVLVKEWKPLDFVVDILLVRPKEIWKEWLDDNEIKATLTVHQKGAGNGKTFGIWKSIVSNRDKDLFIILTKQHSAKTVILKELNDQADRNEYHISDNILEEYEIDEKNKKYVVQYVHNHSQRKCMVIIGTIDSFVYNLSNNKKNGTDFFEGILQSIAEYGINKMDKSKGTIKYAGETIGLNKKAELWIDEAQDLSDNYFNAIVRVILETKIDVVIVGDKLQTLEHKSNCMTCVANNIPNINIIRHDPDNTNRRIKVNGMANEINKLIKFGVYSLPEINAPDKMVENDEKMIEVIDMPIEPTDFDSKQFHTQNCVEKIIKIVDNEVVANNYLPHNFLFIFPIMKSNQLANTLEVMLNTYWNDKNNNNVFTHYAVLHKHEEGQVIDTSESENSARIVSIRTSKGDGREVVFVLGCTEQALRLVSREDEIGLIYESYLHVALTRAKNKIYFGLEQNNDDVHQRFGSSGLVMFKPEIRTKLSHSKIVDYIDKNAVIEMLKQTGIREIDEEADTKKIKPQIDWEYHCIRRAIYLQYAVFAVLDKIKEKKFDKSQLFAVLIEISKLEVKPRAPNNFYKHINSYGSCDNLTEIPLCYLSRKAIYNSYMQKIKKIIEKNIAEFKNDNLSLAKQSPLEAVLQWYVIQLYRNKQYCETSPTTIYNIIDHFEKDHATKLTELLAEAKIIKDIITPVVKRILDTDRSVNWNIEHCIELEGSFHFDISYRNIQLIGFGDEYVYHFVFKSDYNQLNFWDTMIEIIIERFILYNPKEYGNRKDIEKFKGKKIKTFVFVLSQHRFFEYDFQNELLFSDRFKDLVKQAVIKYFSTYNKMLFNLCSFVKKSTNIWKEKSSSPYEYISELYEKTDIIRDFFMYLHTRSKENKEVVKNITDNYERFCQKITQHISDICDTFFRSNTHSEDTEW